MILKISSEEEKNRGEGMQRLKSILHYKIGTFQWIIPIFYGSHGLRILPILVYMTLHPPPLYFFPPRRKFLRSLNILIKLKPII